MQFRAVKRVSSTPAIPQWDLLTESDQNVGHMMLNRSGGFHTVVVNSLHTGRPIGCRMFEGVTQDTRTQALAWARHTMVSEPAPTRDSLTLLIQQLKESRYSLEMSDDYCYSNGKYAAATQEIDRIRGLLATLEETG